MWTSSCDSLPNTNCIDIHGALVYDCYHGYGNNNEIHVYLRLEKYENNE